MPRRKHRKAVAKRVYRRKQAAWSGGAVGVRGAVRSLQGYQAELVGQRHTLDAQIHAVENALAAMGLPAYGRAPVARRGPGRPPGRPRAGGRPPRPGSLKAYMMDVLSGRGVMAVKDITAGVLAAGYRTKNRTLAKSVGIALTEMKNVAKVGRGRFRLK